MYLYFNRVQMGVRIVAEPELKTTKNGKSTLDLRVAYNRYHKKDEPQVSDYLTVRCWGVLAETVAKLMHKGSLILVEGSICNDSFTDKEGRMRQFCYVLAEKIHSLDMKESPSWYEANNKVPNNFEIAQENKQYASANLQEFNDEELPF